MESCPGLELVFDSAKGQFKSQNDAMICLLHWNFIANGYKCIGSGEETGAESITESEYLPQGWNQSSDVYTLRYQSTTAPPLSFSEKKECYLLKAVSADDTLIINMMSLEEKKLASKIIKTSDYVTDDWNTSWNNTYKNIKEVKTIFKEEFLNTVSPPPASPKPSSSRWQDQRHQRPPYIDDPLRIPSYHPDRSQLWSRGPFEFGRADLDPFADGGGMLFDPFRHNRRIIQDPLPRGAVPPGARYDPIGPGRFHGAPDPDHLPIPNSNDYDDMFM